MSVKMTVDTAKIDKALKLWTKLTLEERTRELRKSGRALAVRLANATQPFGLDATARKKGENAILKDISLITKPLDKYWYEEAVRMRKYDPQAFIRRFKTKDGRVFLQEEDVPLDASTIKGFHQKMRIKSTGRTSRAGTKTRDIGRHGEANRGFVLQPILLKYIKETQRKVGIAKAGWAECAAMLGGFDRVQGVGRIQNWLQKLIAKYGSGTVLVTDKYVSLTNSVPWITRALDRSTMRKTLDIQRNTLAKSIIAIMKHTSKKAGFA